MKDNNLMFYKNNINKKFLKKYTNFDKTFFSVKDRECARMGS